MKRHLLYRGLCQLCRGTNDMAQNVPQRLPFKFPSQYHTHSAVMPSIAKMADVYGDKRKFSTESRMQQIFLPEEDVIVEDGNSLFKNKPEKYKAFAPVDDVYIIDHYPPKVISIHDALEEVRKMDSWAYKGNMDSRLITLDIMVDDALEKKKKVGEFGKTIVPPHPYGSIMKLLVFAEGENARLAQELGADLVLGLDDLDSIANEEVNVKDYKAVLTTPDMLIKLTSIKRFLKLSFPSMRKGTVSKNLPLLIYRHKNGREYHMSKKARLFVNVGKLNLTNEQIEDNIAFFLEHICQHKPTSLGPLVLKVRLFGAFLDSFLVDVDKYLPHTK